VPKLPPPTSPERRRSVITTFRTLADEEYVLRLERENAVLLHLVSVMRGPTTYEEAEHSVRGIGRNTPRLSYDGEYPAPATMREAPHERE
jgi:hypothetical protein